MATQAEMEFLLKMRDEASASFRRLSDTINQTAGGSSNLQKKNKEAAASFDSLVKEGQKAVAAFIGLRASMSAYKGSSTAFAQYELGIVNVAKTTGFAGKELDEFKAKFDALDASMAGVRTDTLLEIAGAAGRLGIKGVGEIVDFTEVIGKLSVTTTIQGDKGTSQVARILNLTKEGAKGVKDFGDALNYMGNTSAANESEILAMATRLAQTTAEFGLGSRQILAFSAAARSLGAPVELTGSAAGRALRNLRDGAANATEGFKDFLTVTNLTKEEFDQMLAQHPEQVLLQFGKAYAALANSGSSVGFLESLGMNTDEIKQVFGTIGQNVELFQQKFAAVGNNVHVGSLDQEFNKFSEAMANQLILLEKRWTSFKKTIGEALKPLNDTLIAGGLASVNELIEQFNLLPESVQTGIASVGTLGLGLVSLIALGRAVAGVFRILGIASSFSLAASATGKFASVLKTVIVAFGSFARVGALIGIAKVAIVSLAGVLGGIISLPVLIAAAFVAGVTLIIAKWDALKAFFSQPWGDIASQIWSSLTSTFDSVIDSLKNGWTAFKDWLSGKNDLRLEAAKEGKANADKAAATKRPDQRQKAPGEVDRGITVPKLLNDVDKNALEKLDEYRKKYAEITEQVRVLDSVINALNSGTQVKGYSVDDLPRLEEMRGRAANQKQQLEARKDPLFELKRDFADQLNAITAVTKEQKNRLAIEEQIRKVVEETGLTYDQVAERIITSMAEIQQAQKQVALADTFRDLDRQIAQAGARTQGEENRLSIIEKITDFERENGRLSEDDRAALQGRLQILQQMQEAKRLMQQLDPVGTAQQRYQEELRTLEVMREQNLISAEMFQRMKGNLDRQTLQSRDPVGARVKEMREELSLMQFTGKQAQIEQSVMQESNRLKDQGVQVTGEMTAALREYATAMQQAKDAQTQGLAGWADQVGTLDENLNKLTSNFADGMADAISGAISGDAGSFRKFAANLGKQMVNMAVKQLMADTIKGFGNPAKDAATSRADAALQKLDALSSAGINAPQAVVNAGTVNINGQGLAAAGLPGSAQAQQAPVLGGSPIPGPLPTDSDYARKAYPIPELKTLPPIQEIKTIEPDASVLPSIKAGELSVPKIEVPKIDVPKIDVPKIDPAKIDVPKVELPKVDVPKVEIPKVANDNLPLKERTFFPSKTQAKPVTAAEQASIFKNVDAGKLEIEKLGGLQNAGRQMQDVRGLVFHHTAGRGTPGGVVNTLNQRGLGIQYVMDREGKVFQTAADGARVSHMRNAQNGSGLSNDNSIGIEMIAKNNADLTEAQKIAGLKFADEMKRKYPNIGDRIYGHGELNKHKESDEGMGVVSLYRERQKMLASKDLKGIDKTVIADARQKMVAAKPDFEQLTTGSITPAMFNKRIPAAIRTNNPGAMWGGASWQKKYGVLGKQGLNDGLGQGNNIAMFPTKEAGAAAQFELLNRKYANMPLGAAVHKWSGGNSSQVYANKLAKATGSRLDTPMREILADRERATTFAKTSAAHEAGVKQFPMSDDQWRAGFDLYRYKNGMPVQQAQQQLPNTPSIQAGQVQQQMATVSSQAVEQSKQKIAELNTSLQQTGQTVPQVTEPMKSLQQSSQMTTGSLGQTNTTMTTFGQQTQLASTSIQTASPSMSLLGMNTQQAGMNATQAGSQFQQASSQMQSAGSQASMAGNSAGGATGGFGGLEGALGGLMGPINQATGGLGSLGMSLLQFIQQLGSSSMGGGGGFGGGFGGLFSIFGFAEGGQIKGPGSGTSDSILARVSNGEFVVNAKSTKQHLPLLNAINSPGRARMPAFAKGGLVGGGLITGERAVARAGNSRDAEMASVVDHVNKLTDRVNSRDSTTNNNSLNVVVHARDIGGFKKHEGQLLTDASFQMQRMAKRNG